MGQGRHTNAAVLSIGVSTKRHERQFLARLLFLLQDSDRGGGATPEHLVDLLFV